MRNLHWLNPLLVSIFYVERFTSILLHIIQKLCFLQSSLKRTVDELTQKCHKSIELIRLSKKNSLSPSVENLLESVVESSTLIGAEREAAAQNTAGRRGSGGAGSSGGEEPAENISNRLERLSSAFDAIQKYLEESTTSTSGNNQSPTSGGISKTIAAK